MSKNEPPLNCVDDSSWYDHDTSKIKDTYGVTQWTNAGDKWFTIGDTQKQIPNGAYDCYVDNNGQPYFQEHVINVDELLEFPDSQSDMILNQISEFWNRGSIFKDFGFLHRRGYLLYGPPGGGKTCLVQLIIKRIIERGGLVLFCKAPGCLSDGLANLRKVEPLRPIVCVFEDIDSLIHTYGEDDILHLLDGENQVDKVLNIATTNYPEELDARIVARPRRFDRLVKVGMPSPSVRQLYFSKKLNITDDELNTWVDETEDFSFAAMAELVISVKCLGNDFTESVEAIKSLMENTAHSNEFKNGGKSVGFN